MDRYVHRIGFQLYFSRLASVRLKDEQGQFDKSTPIRNCIGKSKNKLKQSTFLKILLTGRKQIYELFEQTLRLCWPRGRFRITNLDFHLLLTKLCRLLSCILTLVPFLPWFTFLKFIVFCRFKVAYYSFIRVQEVQTINVQI